MKIFQVERTLVATARISQLENRRLLVVKERGGGRQVAVDRVGCKPGDYVVSIGCSAARIAAGDPRIATDLTVGGIIDHWSEEEWRR